MSSISLSDWSDKALTTVDASGAGDATLPKLEVLGGRTAAPGRANWRCCCQVRWEQRVLWANIMFEAVSVERAMENTQG